MPRSNSSRDPLVTVLAAVFFLVSFGCAGPHDPDQGDRSGPAPGGVTSGEVHADTLAVDGVEREFSYFRPQARSGDPRPVVIYLHGHGDNMRHILGRGLVSSPSSVWMRVAEREDFLVLFPLGAKGPGWRGKTGWNDCRSGAEGNPDEDDIAFLRGLIDFAATRLGGDRSRVYVTGMSNGGHMAMRAAMEMSAEVAAVAPVVALLPEASHCAPPSQPVSILMLHGTEDPIAPFAGGPMAGGRGEVLSARATMDTWIRWNGLEGAPETETWLPDEDPSDGSRALVRARELSPGGIAVVAYELQGAGHTEPSRTEKLGRLLQRVQGKQNRDIEMAEVIWSFFRDR